MKIVITKKIGNMTRAVWEGFQTYGGTKLKFWINLGAQLFPIIPMIER
jgi:hypothetical protein